MDKNLRFLRKSVLGPLDSESSTPSPPNPLVSVLLGFSQPTFHQPDSSKSITFLDDNLNESQRKAVHFVLNETEEVGLIRESERWMHDCSSFIKQMDRPELARRKH